MLNYTSLQATYFMGRRITSSNAINQHPKHPSNATCHKQYQDTSRHPQITLRIAIAPKSNPITSIIVLGIISITPSQSTPGPARSPTGRDPLPVGLLSVPACRRPLLRRVGSDAPRCRGAAGRRAPLVGDGADVPAGHAVARAHVPAQTARGGELLSTQRTRRLARVPLHVLGEIAPVRVACAADRACTRPAAAWGRGREGGVVMVNSWYTVGG